MTAERLMLLAGVSVFLVTLGWVRGRMLRERHAIAWMLLAGLLLVCGIFPGIIMRFAEAARLSYPAAVLFVSLGAIYCFSFFVTTSLTRQHRRTICLLQEIGILKSQLASLRLYVAETRSLVESDADRSRGAES
jgi:hypothetical protein